MITNIRIELSDDERARVGAAVYGKPKPVTRMQLHEIVDMVIEQLKADADDVQPTQPGMGQPLPPLPPGAHGTYGKLGPESDLYPPRGKPEKPNDPDYMRGWNAVGRAIQQGRLKR